MNDTYECLELPDFPFPIETNPSPSCQTFRAEVPNLLKFRSAYYQNTFFTDLAAHLVAPVPVFSAGTLSDPLFTSVEHRRMVERLKATFPGYPVKEYYGDYAHFVQAKVKEWADVCEDASHKHRVCTYKDYQSGTQIVSEGVNTRLSRFIDFYANPPADPTPLPPTFDVTASLQICPANATPANPADEPGTRISASKFSDLAPNSLTVVTTCASTETTSNIAVPNLHALSSDPIVRFLAGIGGGDYCTGEKSPAGPGVVTYDSVALPHGFTMIGRTRVTVSHSIGGLQLDARLYDVSRSPGSVVENAILVDRGMYRTPAAETKTTFDLNGNAWFFPAGHRIRVELGQDNAPYIKHSYVPSLLQIGDPATNGITIVVPIREAAAQLTGSCK